MKQEICGRLAALRKKMAEAGVDIYVVPMGDFHGSEYISDHFRTVRFLTGFTGSAATVAVTQEDAWLWTDGRYFLQAEQQLEGTGVTLMRAGLPETPSVPDHLAAQLPESGTLGFDGRVVMLREADAWQKAIQKKQGKLLVTRDLVGEIWDDRPAMAFGPLFDLPREIYEEEAAAKIARVRAEMEKQGCSAHIISALDEIAWLLNLRGRDVDCNPVFFSYMLIGRESAKVFLKQSVLSDEIRGRIEAQGAEIGEYAEFLAAVSGLPADSTVLLDPSRTGSAVRAALPEGSKVKLAADTAVKFKSVKNASEQKALRESHRRDGVAMVRFLYWLKHHPDVSELTEVTAAEHLDLLRTEMGAFELSFGTISAYGSNGAIVHYGPRKENCARLAPKGFLLVDSGGQYLTGTTDITRTIALGPLSYEEKHYFTAVLRGHLRLQGAIFPKGCTGQNLDILARGPLWEERRDYRHGTGHGVGFCLNVHEGPNSFRWQPAFPTPAFEPGMVTTDEPGYYQTGDFGIRIENELLCVPAGEDGYGDFLKFEPLTLCPIDREAILKEEMDASEIRLLNEYHAFVWERLKDSLPAPVAAWLREETRPL